MFKSADRGRFDSIVTFDRGCSRSADVTVTSKWYDLNLKMFQDNPGICEMAFSQRKERES